MAVNFAGVPRAHDNLFEEWYASKKNFIFETEHSIVFLAEIVRAKGQLLIVPKNNVSSMNELSKEELCDLWQTVYRFVSIVREKLPSVGIMTAQNDMFWQAQPDDPYHIKHVHVHVIPKTGDTDFTTRTHLSDEEIVELLALYKQ